MSHRRLVHIVDDEVKVRDSLALLLSTAQIETRTYPSAEDYLASVRWDEPACVVLDNQLPGLSGIDLVKRIAEAASDTAVIMITGYADVPTAVAAMRAGAYHFVQKPIDAEELLITVEEALARRDQNSELPSGNPRNHGSVCLAHPTRARSLRFGDRGPSDEAHRLPPGNHFPNGRASSSSGDAQNAGAHYFSFGADGDEPWSRRRRPRRRDIGTFYNFRGHFESIYAEVFTHSREAATNPAAQPQSVYNSTRV